MNELMILVVVLLLIFALAWDNRHHDDVWKDD